MGREADVRLRGVVIQHQKPGKTGMLRARKSLCGACCVMHVMPLQAGWGMDVHLEQRKDKGKTRQDKKKTGTARKQGGSEADRPRRGWTHDDHERKDGTVTDTLSSTAMLFFSSVYGFVVVAKQSS